MPKLVNAPTNVCPCSHTPGTKELAWGWGYSSVVEDVSRKLSSMLALKEKHSIHLVPWWMLLIPAVGRMKQGFWATQPSNFSRKHLDPCSFSLSESYPSLHSNLYPLNSRPIPNRAGTRLADISLPGLPAGGCQRGRIVPCSQPLFPSQGRQCSEAAGGRGPKLCSSLSQREADLPMENTS